MPDNAEPLPAERARGLRRNMTIPERRLWNQLRDRRLAGLKFRRQHPIAPYFVDFYCAEHNLVIELDGKSHDGRAEYDRERETFLKNAGLQVLRVDNADVLFEMDAVLRGILKACGIEADALPSRSPSPQPSPRSTGERGQE